MGLKEKLVATKCCICNRPLGDAESVELGMGPKCRKKTQYDFKGCTSEAKEEANALVVAIAQKKVMRKGNWKNEINEALVKLNQLGFEKLAKIILCSTLKNRVIRVMTEGDEYVVKVPWRDGVASEFQRIPGRRWDHESKTNHIPRNEENKLMIWSVLCRVYPGEYAVGSKGGFWIKPFPQGK